MVDSFQSLAHVDEVLRILLLCGVGREREKVGLMSEQQEFLLLFLAYDGKDWYRSEEYRQA